MTLGPAERLSTRGEVHASSVEPELILNTFGGVFVQDFTLDARGREFLVRLGPSGCAKSTVLRLIAGLDVLTSGTIPSG